MILAEQGPRCKLLFFCCVCRVTLLHSIIFLFFLFFIFFIFFFFCQIASFAQLSKFDAQQIDWESGKTTTNISVSSVIHPQYFEISAASKQEQNEFVKFCNDVRERFKKSKLSQESQQRLQASILAYRGSQSASSAHEQCARVAVGILNAIKDKNCNYLYATSTHKIGDCLHGSKGATMHPDNSIVILPYGTSNYEQTTVGVLDEKRFTMRALQRQGDVVQFLQNVQQTVGKDPKKKITSPPHDVFEICSYNAHSGLRFGLLSDMKSIELIDVHPKNTKQDAANNECQLNLKIYPLMKFGNLDYSGRSKESKEMARKNHTLMVDDDGFEYPCAIAAMCLLNQKKLYSPKHLFSKQGSQKVELQVDGDDDRKDGENKNNEEKEHERDRKGNGGNNNSSNGNGSNGNGDSSHVNMGGAKANIRCTFVDSRQDFGSAQARRPDVGGAVVPGEIGNEKYYFKTALDDQLIEDEYNYMKKTIENHPDCPVLPSKQDFFKAKYGIENNTVLAIKNLGLSLNKCQKINILSKDQVRVKFDYVEKEVMKHNVDMLDLSLSNIVYDPKNTTNKEGVTIIDIEPLFGQ